MIATVVMIACFLVMVIFWSGIVKMVWNGDWKP